MIRFSQEKLDGHLAHIASLEEQRNGLNEKNTEILDATDGGLDSKALVKVLTRNNQIADLDGQIILARNKAERLEELRPRTKAEMRGDQTPLERYLRGGTKRLGEDEIRQMQDECKGDFRSQDGDMCLTGELARSSMLEIEARRIEMGLPRAATLDWTTADTGAGGNAGKAVDDHIVPTVIERIQAFSNGLSKMSKLVTEGGNEQHWPKYDGVDEEGALMTAEATDVGDADASAITNVSIGAYTGTTKEMFISRELITDIAFDIVSWVDTHMIRRLGKLLNKYAINGTGTNQPEGIATVAGAGLTAAAQTAVTWQELLKVQESIDDGYLEGYEDEQYGLRTETAGVCYIMSRNALFQIMQMADSENRPLWLPGIAAGRPGKIHGYDYIKGYGMDSMVAGKAPIIFGNLKHMMLRMVEDVRIFNFWDSRTARRNVQSYLGFCRFDIKHIGPTVAESGEQKADAIRKIQMAA